MLTHRLPNYLHLMRFDKPIGILLLLWPTLWGLWLAADGLPPFNVLVVFILGVVVMRAAGCIINDYADKEFDAHVERTKNRPLATKRVSTQEALGLLLLTCLIALILVSFCNWLTIKLAFFGLLLAIIYPYLKRVTHLPQLGLGFAFAWGVPMAFAAVQENVPFVAWLLYLPCVIWPVIYDTFYAMVDRQHDMKINVKSTAILFYENEKPFIGGLQFSFLLLMIWVGMVFQLNVFFYLSLLLSGGLFLYQLRLMQNKAFFQAFLNNNWVGFIIFIGIMLGLSK